MDENEQPWLQIHSITYSNQDESGYEHTYIKSESLKENEIDITLSQYLLNTLDEAYSNALGGNSESEFSVVNADLDGDGTIEIVLQGLQFSDDSKVYINCYEFEDLGLDNQNECKYPSFGDEKIEIDYDELKQMIEMEILENSDIDKNIVNNIGKNN